MLHHQNEVLISHAQLMNENQAVIKNLLKNQKRPNQGQEMENNKFIIQELLKPLQSQVDEVRRVYEETRKFANDVNDSLNTVKKGKKLDLDDQPKQEKEFVDRFGNYIVILYLHQTNQQKLRSKFSEADDLAQAYKEKFKDLESFES